MTTLAGSASIGFREPLGGAELTAILEGGEVPDDRVGHLMRIVDEMPVEMLARAVALFPPGQRQAVLAVLRRLDETYGATGRIGHWLSGE